MVALHILEPGLESAAGSNGSTTIQGTQPDQQPMIKEAAQGKKQRLQGGTGPHFDGGTRTQAQAVV
eukprot:7688299-Prorocentrum_lima.AAC.1